MHKTIWGKLYGPYGGCVRECAISLFGLAAIFCNVGESLGFPIMLCSRDEDTLICTLLSVRWMYFDEDTLICTLLSVR